LYRVLFIVIAVLAVALGLVIGTLNSDTVEFVLPWVQLQWPLGLLILCVFAAGLLAGLLLSWIFGVVPLRFRLRKTGGKNIQGPDG